MAGRKRMHDDEGSHSSTSKKVVKLDYLYYQDWPEEDVAEYLTERGHPNEAALLLEQHITGTVLEDLTEPLLQNVGVKSLGKRLILLREIKKLTYQRTPKEKPKPAQSTSSESVQRPSATSTGTKPKPAQATSSKSSQRTSATSVGTKPKPIQSTSSESVQRPSATSTGTKPKPAQTTSSRDPQRKSATLSVCPKPAQTTSSCYPQRPSTTPSFCPKPAQTTSSRDPQRKSATPSFCPKLAQTTSSSYPQRPSTTPSFCPKPAQTTSSRDPQRKSATLSVCPKPAQTTSSKDPQRKSATPSFCTKKKAITSLFTEAEEQKFLEDYHNLQDLENKQAMKSVGIKGRVEMLYHSYTQEVRDEFTLDQLYNKIRRMLKKQKSMEDQGILHGSHN